MSLEISGFKVLTLLDLGPFLLSLLPCCSSCIENPKSKSLGNRRVLGHKGHLRSRVLFPSYAFSYVVVLVHSTYLMVHANEACVQQVKMISVVVVIDVPFSCDKSRRTIAGCPRTGSRDQDGTEAHEQWIVQSH